MKRYFIDSNIFLRTIVQENQKVFKDCRSFLQLIKGNQIKAYTCGLVLAEVLWVLSSYYHIKKPGLIEALESILNLRGLRVIDKIDYLAAEKIYEKYNVKFIDAVIASIITADSTKWLIVSYDKDFDKIGIIRKEPGKICLT